MILWQPKEGPLIPLTEMTDSHLQNTINYLQRRKKQLNEEINFAYAYYPQGEMAQDAIDQGINSTREDLLRYDFYIKHMEQELLRRQSQGTRNNKPEWVRDFD